MRDLLQSNERRRLEMIEILQSKKDYVTLSTLSDELDYSRRILKTDIAYLKENFNELSIRTSHKGIGMSFNKNSGIESIYQRTLKESIVFQLLEFVLFNEGKHSEELSEIFFISTSTLHRLKEKINRTLNSHYGLTFTSNPYEVVGSEKKIRYFYSQYFAEKYSSLEWPFENIDEDVFEQFLLFFIDYTKMPVDFAKFRDLKIVTAVNLIRFQRQHLIEKNSGTNFSEIISDLSVYKRFFHPIEKKLQITINLKSITQLFTAFVQKDFSLSYERLIQKTRYDSNIKNEVFILSELLDLLSQDHNIPLFNKNDVLLALHNASSIEGQDAQSGYILFNRNKYFSNSIKNTYPDLFYKMYNGLKDYRKKSNRTVSETALNYLTYTLFTSWKNLVPELHRKRESIRTLIISNEGIQHANMIKDLITYEFTEQLSIDIFDEKKLSLKKLKKMPYDILIANYPLPDLESPYCISIESIPTVEDIDNIKDAVIQSNLIKSARLYTL